MRILPFTHRQRRMVTRPQIEGASAYVPIISRRGFLGRCGAILLASAMALNWPATVRASTDSIGATGRDHGTIGAWHSQLAAEAEVGQCYNDDIFDEDVLINDADPTSIVLEAAAGERHDGTAGSGVRIDRSAAGNAELIESDYSGSCICRWIEFDGNDQSQTGNLEIADWGTGTTGDFHHCLLHNWTATGSAIGLRLTGAADAFRLFVWAITSTSSGADGSWGLFATSAVSQTLACCTIFNIVNNNGTGAARGVENPDDAQHTYQNLLALTVSGSGSGTHLCYTDQSIGTATMQNCGSSDSSASGTNPETGLTDSTELVSTTGGSEDLHLDPGATSIGEGVDLVTTPSGVEDDIDAYDVNAGGDTWDIGADQFQAAGGVPIIGGGFFPG